MLFKELSIEKSLLFILVTFAMSLHQFTALWPEPMAAAPLPALHRAVLDKNLNGLLRLIANESHIDARDSYGMTALHYAAKMGNEKAASVLIGNGADINCRASSKTPLSLAVGAGNEKIVRLLLRKGARPCKRILESAIDVGNAQMVRTLLTSDKSVNERKLDGLTPLMKVAGSKDVQMARVLIELGADVNSFGYGGITALHRAASIGSLEMVHLLLDSGAALEVRDYQGRTPLFYAVGRSQKHKTALLLLRGADLNSKDSFGRTPFELAKEKKQLGMVRFLATVD